MANSKYQKKKIQDTENSGFGNYDEGVGGGASPNDSKQGTHGHGANSDYRKENNDTMQARTADGKFTYKSVNGQSIDPKYGPSRGKTVNPLLTGGKNGIKIDDVENQFSAQKGGYWDKYKDSWYTKGGEMALKSGKTFSTRVAGKSIWDLAKERYDEAKGEFEGESHTFDETKKGRHTLDEKAALQKAKKTKSEQAVIDSNTGGIRVKPGTQLPTHPVAPTPTPAQPTAPTPVAPSTPAPQPQPTVSAQAPVGSSQLKHSADELKEGRQALIDAGLDAETVKDMTDETLDQLWDQFFESDTNDDADEANNEISQEEDSDSIKKIKDLGFNG